MNQGVLEERFRYDAFGGNYEGELETDERGYNGKPHDPVTGFYNYGYRDYDPMTGRFATVDPIRDGRHWYVYVGNDPVNYVDPLGLDSRELKQPEIDYMQKVIGDRWRRRNGHIIDYTAIKVHDRGADRADYKNINSTYGLGISTATINNQSVNGNRPMALPGGNIFIPSNTPDEVTLHEVVHVQQYIRHGNSQALNKLMGEQANYDKYLQGGKKDESLNPYNYDVHRTQEEIQTLDHITTYEGRAKFIEDFAKRYYKQSSSGAPFGDVLKDQAKVMKNSGFESDAINEISP